ncbi:MAG TPA: Calx-beta domain-containing protein [Verrucomicrobiae bacterium]
MNRRYLLLFVIGVSSLALTAFSQTIVNPLPVINLYPLDAGAAEVPVGPQNMASFRVTHNFPPTATVSFLFTLGGTAREGDDYLALPASNMTSSLFGRWFTFPAGQSEAEMVIAPVDDLLVESDETVTLSLYTPPFNGAFGTPADWRDSFGFAYGSNSTAVVTILSDDTASTPFALVTIAATDATGSEIPPAFGARDPAVFTLTRTGSNLGAITVNYSFDELPGTFPPTLPIPVMARNGIDFETLSGSVTFAEGAATAEIVVHPIFDLLREASEYVKVTLQPSPLPASEPGSYVIDQNTTAVAHILNFASESIPTVTIAVNDPQAIEDNVLRRTGSITVTRQGSVDKAITVPYRISGTALNGVDYVTLPGFVTFPAGRRGALILIDPIKDNLREGVESVDLRLLAPPPGIYPPPYLVGNPGSAGVAIRDHLRWSANFASTGQVTTSLERLPDGTFILGAPSLNVATTNYIVEASTDLVHWEEIGTANVIESFAEFVDANAANLPARFYRMRPAASGAAVPSVNRVEAYGTKAPR